LQGAKLCPSREPTVAQPRQRLVPLGTDRLGSAKGGDRRAAAGTPPKNQNSTAFRSKELFKNLHIYLSIYLNIVKIYFIFALNLKIKFP
jgi:hypothetical protein